jgi:hypothetical protein
VLRIQKMQRSGLAMGKWKKRQNVVTYQANVRFGRADVVRNWTFCCLRLGLDRLLLGFN